jgi:hypothetical protein
LSAALLLEPLFKKIRNRLRINIKAWWWKGFCILRTWGLILLAQYFAFTAGPKQGLSLLGATFQNWTFADAGATLTGLLEPLEWYIVLVALLLVLAVDLMIEFGADVNGKLAGGSFLVRWPVLIGLIVTVLVFGCYGAGFDAVAFLYTQF